MATHHANDLHFPPPILTSSSLLKLFWTMAISNCACCACKTWKYTKPFLQWPLFGDSLVMCFNLYKIRSFTPFRYLSWSRSDKAYVLSIVKTHRLSNKEDMLWKKKGTSSLLAMTQVFRRQAEQNSNSHWHDSLKWLKRPASSIIIYQEYSINTEWKWREITLC